MQSEKLKQKCASFEFSALSFDRSTAPPLYRSTVFQRGKPRFPYCAPDRSLYFSPGRTLIFRGKIVDPQSRTPTIPSTGRENGGKEGWKKERQEGREEGRREEKGCETASRQEGEEEADAERGVHGAKAARSGSRRGRRQQPDAAHRDHEEALGLHQAERASGLEGAPHDQRRRQAQGRFRRQEQSLDVRDDQAGQQAHQVALVGRLHSGGRVHGHVPPLSFLEQSSVLPRTIAC